MKLSQGFSQFIRPINFKDTIWWLRNSKLLSRQFYLMNMLQMLLTLIPIFLFALFGQAFDSQRNNEDIFQKDSRGMLLHESFDITNKRRFLLSSNLLSRSLMTFLLLLPSSILSQMTAQHISSSFLSQQSPWQQLQENSFLLCNKDKSEIMTPCLLHHAKSAANHAIPRNLLLLYVQHEPAIMIPSLLLICVRDAPAIMMAPFANFSLQLIVENPSLLLFCVSIVGR